MGVDKDNNNKEKQELNEEQRKVLELRQLGDRIINMPENTQKEYFENLSKNPKLREGLKGYITDEVGFIKTDYLSGKELSNEDIFYLRGYAHFYLNMNEDKAYSLTQNDKDIINTIFNQVEAKESHPELLNGLRDKLKRFDEAKIDGFDSKPIIDSVRQVLNDILNNPKIDKSIKDKFVRDFQECLKNLDNVEFKSIEGIRGAKEFYSLGLETNKKDGYYLLLSIKQKFLNELQLKGTVIQECFVEPPIIEYGREYNQKNLEKFKTNISELDGKYGMNMGELLKPGCEHYPFDVLEIKIQNKILENVGDENRLREIKEYQTSNQVFPPMKAQFKNGVDINIGKVKDEYIDLYWKFRKDSFQYRGVKMDIMDGQGYGMMGVPEKVEGKFEDAFGWEKIDTNMDVENLYSKLEDMEPADLVIILNQFAGITPVYGGFQNLHDAWNKYEPDGNEVGGVGRSFLFVCGLCDISVIFSFVAKIGKAERIAKSIKAVKKIIDVLKDSRKLEKLLSNPETIMLLKKIERFPGVDEILYTARNSYLAKFDGKVPDVLTKGGKIIHGWIDEMSQIYINSNEIQKLDIKAETIDGVNKFNGMSLIDFLKQKPPHPNSIKFLEHLKTHLTNEVVHRIMGNLKEIKVGKNTYSQEEIAMIIDGRKEIDKIELTNIQEKLKQELGKDVKFLDKDGNISKKELSDTDEKMFKEDRISKNRDIMASSERLRKCDEVNNLLPIGEMREKYNTIQGNIETKKRGLDTLIDNINLSNNDKNLFKRVIRESYEDFDANSLSSLRHIQQDALTKIDNYTITINGQQRQIAKSELGRRIGDFINACEERKEYKIFTDEIKEILEIKDTKQLNKLLDIFIERLNTLSNDSLNDLFKIIKNGNEVKGDFSSNTIELIKSGKKLKDVFEYEIKKELYKVVKFLDIIRNKLKIQGNELLKIERQIELSINDLRRSHISSGGYKYMTLNEIENIIKGIK